MMRRGTPTLTSLSRSLAMLEAVIADGGARSVAALARELGVPAATAHRQIHSLVEQGYLARHGGGGHVAGPRLLALLGQLDEKQVIANAAAPVLHQLAADLGCVVQLGTLDGDMVTYRIKTGQGAGNLFTRVGMQHEAYCSGIGKVLLAHLPEDQQQTYLAGGPFPALTARTITDARALAAELHKVSEQGHAIDDGEVADGLICVAVPVHQPDGRVLAAVSISQSGAAVHPPAVLMPRLQAVAAEIERAAFGRTFR